MNLTSLRWLTWATIAGSVASALLLAAGDSSPNGRRAGASAGVGGDTPPRLLLRTDPLHPARHVGPASGASR